MLPLDVAPPRADSLETGGFSTRSNVFLFFDGQLKKGIINAMLFGLMYLYLNRTLARQYETRTVNMIDCCTRYNTSANGMSCNASTMRMRKCVEMLVQEWQCGG